MRNIFRWDSPFAQKLALVGNLVVLNILWVVCSLPVVTMGAATAAMYHTVFQFMTNEEDQVIVPFFRGFKNNFWQATGVWMVLLAIGALMIFNVVFLLQQTTTYFMLMAVWTAVLVVSVIVVLIQTQLIPMLARFEMKTVALVKSSILLVLLHFPSTLMMAALNLVPIVAFGFFPEIALKCSILWVGLWFALVAYLNGRMLLKLWKKHMPAEEEKPEENSEEETIKA